MIDLGRGMRDVGCTPSVFNYEILVSIEGHVSKRGRLNKPRSARKTWLAAMGSWIHFTG